MAQPLDLEEKLTAARALEPLVMEHREAIDRERKLPPPVADALGDFGVFRALVPAAAGGGEWEQAGGREVHVL